MSTSPPQVPAARPCRLPRAGRTGRAGRAAAAGGLALVGVAAAVSGCVSTPQAPAPVAGCYYFERDAGAERLNLPWGVRLLPDSLTGWPAIQQHAGVRRAETLLDFERTAAHPFGYWRPLGADSVEVGYPGGGGLLLLLGIEDVRLAGRARAVGDALPPPGETARFLPFTRVVLGRAACPDGVER
jgi:hypothetical protein